MTRLGALVRLYRTVHHVSLDAVAGEMHITRRRLSAIEQGRGGSLQTFAKVLVWLLAQESAPPLLAAPSTRRPPAPGLRSDAPGVADSVADAVAE
jgi:transcriptional regulator with XRE-family HTH domain